MGWSSVADLFAGIWDRFFSSKRHFASIEKKIENLEDKIEEYIKNKPSNSRNRELVSKWMSELAKLRKELQRAAD